MGRYRRNRGGGAKTVLGGGSSWMGFTSIIFGCVGAIIAFIMFGIAIGQLDTAYTSASAYSEQTGLTSVMGMWGMVLFVIFALIGLAGLVAGGYLNTVKALSGNWMSMFMGIIMGGITIAIAVIMNGTIQSSLHDAYVTANATTNKASFTGMLSVMGIFGMVYFISLMLAGVAPIGGAIWGGVKKIRGR